MNTNLICPVCRVPLPPNAPAGLCPVCLLKTDPATEPAPKAQLGEPASTLTIGPDTSARVRYFGDYELQKEIARGGMGVVWKARQSSLNRTVAVKMILAGKLAGVIEVQRFRREAEAAANLQHPNIVAIHEVGEHDGQHYYSMDYVDGRDLGALVRETGPLPPTRAAECVKTIAEAVHFAHQRGTLHRDLKPQNVLIDAAGVARVTDFGLAKFVERDESMTQSGAVMGSPSYMPPEQAAGHLDQIGPHSDVYSLGAILYELLTARPPFRAETAIATMRQVMESEPVAPRKLNSALPPDLETICLKCLEKNPARRYPSARALAEELGRFLNHEPIQALRPSAIRRAESWLRRHPWTLTASASLVVLVLSGMLYWQYERMSFLQSGPSLTDRTLAHPGWRTQQVKTWDDLFSLMSIMMSGLMIFQVYARGMLGRKQLSEQPTVWQPPRPLSHRTRVVCGLLSAAALGFTVLYLAKLIQVSVWESTPKWSRWLRVYAYFSISLSILFWVVRDYQKFVYGMPSRNLSAEQSELLRQAIFDGDISRAVRLYRRTIPDAELPEANDYIGKLAAELRTKHPEKFAPPARARDLNWRWMGACLVVQLGVFAGFWMMMPPETFAARFLTAAAGFVLGAGAFFSLRLKTHWRGVALALCLGLAAIAMAQVSQLALSAGLVFGAFLVLSGFIPKRRKSTPSKRTLTDGSPTL